MTVNDADTGNDLVVGEEENGKPTGPRIKTFNDGLSAADRAEAILDAIIAAKGGSRRDGQVQMAREVATALSEQKPLLIQGGTGIGKALDVNTLIPTPRGFVRMGDLKAGDWVFNEEGKPVKVLEAFAFMENRPCYRVTFSDGSEIIADGGHLWTTETITSMILGAPWGGAKTLTTEEIRKSLRNSSGRANHRIPLTQPLQTPHANVPVSPYRLGVWVAGLNLRGDEAYAVGKNLAAKLLRVETTDGAIVQVKDLSTDEQNRRLRVVLRREEIAAIREMMASAVRIPEQYLFASVKQRRSLMAGMLDVSGHVIGNNQVRFQDHRKQVAQDFAALASSLGYRASLTKRKDCRNVWLVSFSTTDKVFRNEQKNSQIVQSVEQSNSSRRVIVSIEPVESRPVRCITVDSPRHLFLAGRSMVPTHNSIAYLAGALASGRQAVVAPHTKALQDQLKADLDLIREAFPDGSGVIPTPSYAIIKGRSAYLCLSKMKGENTPPEAPESLQELFDITQGTEPSSEVGKQVKKLHEWGEETKTGERSDLPWPISGKAWEQVSTNAGDCLGKACSFAKECFSNIQRQKAYTSDIIVVNQAFLAAWMKTPQILPENVGAVLVDEAHEFASVVAEAFGSNVTPGRIEHTISRALSALTKADAKERAEVGAREAKEAAVILGNKLVIPNPRDRTSMTVPTLVTKEITVVNVKLSRLREQVDAYVSTSTDQEAAKKQNLIREMDNLLADLKMILEGRTDEQVVWAEKGFQGKVGLRAARFDVSETIFGDLLYRIRSVVFTSATLTIGGTFALPARTFGFNMGPWSGQVVGSPFDYETQGLVWMPEGMPAPGTGDQGIAYTKRVAEVAEETARAAGGRTLVLCTSNASVKTISEHLALKMRGHTVLAQGVGDLSAKELAKRFTEDPKAILVGTRTFWTGISVEGDTCAAVVIDKIPFPVPTEPIIKARSDKADKLGGPGTGFKTVSLAEACLTMVQGAGRLVRTIHDRGVIVICDPRLHPGGPHLKSYGPAMLRDLPPFPVTSDRERALTMLKEIDKTANDSVAKLEIDEAEEA